MISTWAEAVVTPETGLSVLDLVTRTHLHSDNPHSAEVDSTAEVEEGAEVTLAFAAIAVVL